jgi:hypothetical protein
MAEQILSERNLNSEIELRCFVLLEASFIQMKLNRIRTKQRNSISEFRLKAIDLTEEFGSATM